MNDNIDMTDETLTPLLIGIDIGGTFTDFVVHDTERGKISSYKLLSTPFDPSQAVIQGLKVFLKDHINPESSNLPLLTITHGSTVATNALLERKGARTALVTTAGFKDVLEIGRQNRANLYDLNSIPAEIIVPRSWRYEVDERVDYQGGVLKDIDQDEITRLVSTIRQESIQSVAICLLFSFLYPEHEQQIARELRKTGLYVSQSSQVLPEYREYERTSTTVLNAYVTPIIDEYLGSLESSLTELGKQIHLRIMQSNGGIISVGEARQNAVRCIVSGPAGGVVGANFIGQAALTDTSNDALRANQSTQLKLITIDMGGTSTDVSLVEQHPTISTESIIGGLPIGIPMLDVHTIGAGGGSVAHVDRGGALRVGPESAGANPGPACYALGDANNDLPTVTDANVVLGRLPVDHFLDGRMQLKEERAFSVMEQLGAELGLDAVQAARGVVDVINAHMERALRLVSIERGHDPEEFVLLSFGGAGGLHAAALARKLSIPKVIIPPLASTLSAFGMLVADVIKDYSQTVMLPGSEKKEKLDQAFEPLIVSGKDDLHAEGMHDTMMRLIPSLDMRYRGQSFELNIPYGDHYLDEFHKSHDQNYGYSHPGADVEIVNIRLRATGLNSPPEIPGYQGRDDNPSNASLGFQPVLVKNQVVETQIFKGALLTLGNQIEGPAVIVRKDTTVFLPGGSISFVDRYLNLVISFND